jgi:LuxR family transcriptional regulator, quorum-sensing system regulator SdiA
VDSQNELIRRLRRRSPAGFAIALHVTYTTPKYYLVAYEKDWLDYYSSKGFIMNDPTAHWGFANTGSIRWSELKDNDPAGVLSDAARFGLKYGLTTSVLADGSRTIASFARDDREMSDIDAAAIRKDVAELHRLTLGAEFFTPNLHETLRQLSIYLTHG